MNKCGDCTACCEFFYIEELQKPKNTMCSNCTGTGCGIYSDRPQTCKDYQCEWLKGGWNEQLRPDKCGVLVDLNIDGYQALRIKDDVDPIILEQIAFIKSNYGVDIVGVDARQESKVKTLWPS